MRTNVRTTTVQGKQYTVWSDFIKRGSFAENEAGEVKQIKFNGYLSNDLSIRKAIAYTFALDSFRK